MQSQKVQQSISCDTCFSLSPVSTPTAYAEKVGDLFSARESLAHCISADVVMGKGIALTFKTKFQGSEELRKQNPQVGKVCVLQREGRFIYYLITKPRYFHKPSYDTLRASLLAMKEHCLANRVTAVAMPQIGCGLDGLKWPAVRDIIKEMFPPKDGIQITVYILRKPAGVKA
eukprot:EG_transcript_22040